uniref:DNA-directed DNA polymerase family A palm domain-containing protein n=1 Tax=Alexandrium monilatum TaxID=311494 RepID=A0A7S4V6N1_9DINO
MGSACPGEAAGPVAEAERGRSCSAETRRTGAAEPAARRAGCGRAAAPAVETLKASRDGARHFGVVEHNGIGRSSSIRRAQPAVQSRFFQRARCEQGRQATAGSGKAVEPTAGSACTSKASGPSPESPTAAPRGERRRSRSARTLRTSAADPAAGSALRSKADGSPAELHNAPPGKRGRSRSADLRRVERGWSLDDSPNCGGANDPLAGSRGTRVPGLADRLTPSACQGGPDNLRVESRYFKSTGEEPNQGTGTYSKARESESRPPDVPVGRKRSSSAGRSESASASMDHGGHRRRRRQESDPGVDAAPADQRARKPPAQSAGVAPAVQAEVGAAGAGHHAVLSLSRVGGGRVLPPVDQQFQKLRPQPGGVALSPAAGAGAAGADRHAANGTSHAGCGAVPLADRQPETPLPQPRGTVLAVAAGGGAGGTGSCAAFSLSRASGSPLVGGLDRLEELRSELAAAPSVVAFSARGVDVLKWLLAQGEEEVAWKLAVHDVGLMRNALDGSAPSAAGSRAAAGWGRAGAVAAAQLQTAAKEAQLLWSRLLACGGAMRTYALAQRAQILVAEMETAGIPFNHGGLELLVERWRKELREVEADTRKTISRAVGKPMHGLNLQSPQQVAELITTQLSTEELRAWPLCTSSSTLKRCSLPFAKLVTRCRELHHSLSHYSPYCLAAAAGGGRLFPTHQLGGAVTGRMSCASPNLHGTPRQPEFRALVAVPPPERLVKGDFSQIELRVLAEVSGDERMRRAFAAGEDLHRLTAGALLQVPPEEVTAQHRQLAKAVNFGLVFGQSAAGLQHYAQASYGVELTLDEAQVARRRFFQTYPGVAAWQRQQRDRAGRGQDLATPCGRLAHHLRAVWRDGGVPALRRLEREALNFPIQGGAAEVMLACLDRLRGHVGPMRSSCRLVCVVHDEFLLECADTAAAEAAAAALHHSMMEAWRQVFPLAAPLGDHGAAIGIGENWSDLEPWPGPRKSESGTGRK